MENTTCILHVQKRYIITGAHWIFKSKEVGV